MTIFLVSAAPTIHVFDHPSDHHIGGRGSLKRLMAAYWRIMAAYCPVGSSAAAYWRIMAASNDS
jgi:hypothetical protein